MKLIIDADLANAILNYLVSKPYAEVFNYVSGLQSLKPIEDLDNIVKQAGLEIIEKKEGIDG